MAAGGVLASGPYGPWAEPPRKCAPAAGPPPRKAAGAQVGVAGDVAGQVAGGSWSVVGVMLESNLVAGSQPEPLKSSK